MGGQLLAIQFGGVGEHTSGDLFLAFATGNRGMTAAPLAADVRMLADEPLNDLFGLVVEATEEAILNALLQAETMTGHGGAVAHALEPERLVAALESYRWRPSL